MPSKRIRISIVEKLIATFSLFTVGMFGVIWLIITYFTKRKLSDFLKFNIIQSITIGIVLYLVNIFNNLLITLSTKYKAFNFLTDIINSIFTIKKVRFYELGLSFSYFELLLFIVLFYLFIAILMGKKFHLPIISKIANSLSK